MELSIIVPIYNVEEYLQECLESLYKIEGISKEIILVNDGSPDNSWKIMEEFKAKFPGETVIVNKENGGLSSARNAGIRAAKGKYISFIDSDDFVDPEAFQEFFKLGTAENPDVVIGNMKYYMDGITGDPLFRSQKVKDSGLMTGIEFFALLFDKEKCFREEVVDDLYRRDFLIENNLFFTEGILHEDSEFTPKVYLKAEKAKYIDIPFYFYRQRSGSIMNVLSEKSMDSLEKICYTLADEYDRLDSPIGKETLSKLIISFYKVVVYKYYNAAGKNFKSFHSKYRQLFLRVAGFKNHNFEETLLFFSVALPNFMRRMMGIEITNRQKVPKL